MGSFVVGSVGVGPVGVWSVVLGSVVLGSAVVGSVGVGSDVGCCLRKVEDKGGVGRSERQRLAVLYDCATEVACHDNIDFLELCSGSEAGSYFRLIDVYITQR